MSAHISCTTHSSPIRVNNAMKKKKEKWNVYCAQYPFSAVLWFLRQRHKRKFYAVSPHNSWTAGLILSKFYIPSTWTNQQSNHNLVRISTVEVVMRHNSLYTESQSYSWCQNRLLSYKTIHFTLFYFTAYNVIMEGAFQ